MKYYLVGYKKNHEVKHHIFTLEDHEDIEKESDKYRKANGSQILSIKQIKNIQEALKNFKYEEKQRVI